MIPYFQFTSITLGPVTIHVWGLLVALGVIAGAWAAARLARERNQDEKLVWDAVLWIIVGAMVGGRLMHVVYDPGVYLENPIELLHVWHGGLSVMGGFLGASLVGVWYLRKKKVSVREYADTLLFGLPLGLFVGRIGCFLIHDHPGALTDVFFAVQYPGGARLDHGMLLSINGLVLFLVFLWLRKRQVAYGVYTTVFLIWYGAVRFALDFFRATDGAIVDTRYLGLTPAQYVSIAMVVWGVWLWKKQRKTVEK